MIFQGTAVVSLMIALTQMVVSIWRYHILLKTIDRWRELTDQLLAAGAPPPDPTVLADLVRYGLRPPRDWLPWS
jgi:hypothetical protein